MSTSIADTLAAHRSDANEEVVEPIETQEVKIAKPGPDPFNVDGEKAPPSEASFEDKGHTVPVNVLTEQRRKYTDEAKRSADEAAELRKQVADLTDYVRKMSSAPAPQTQQPPAEKPKPLQFDWENPTAYFEAKLEERLREVLTPIVSNVRRVSEESSKRFAIKEHGQETVDAAFAAMDAAIRGGDRDAYLEKERILRESGDGWEDLVRWHKRSSALKEFGADPAAYKAKVEAEIMDRLQATGAPAPTTERKSKLPPNMPSDLAGARSVGPRAGPSWQGPKSIKETLGR